MVKMSKAGRVQAGYKLESLILQVRGAGLLRQDKKLREMLSIAAPLCGFQENWIDDDSCVTSKATTSRYRFVLHCAHTLEWRRLFQQWLHDELDFKMFLLADSSPRAGVEWMYVELFIILTKDIKAFVRAMHEIMQ